MTTFIIRDIETGKTVARTGSIDTAENMLAEFKIKDWNEETFYEIVEMYGRCVA